MMTMCDVCCKECEPIAVRISCGRKNAEDNYARGVADERARVVAWLRERLIVGADAIERGEHESEGT